MLQAPLAPQKKEEDSQYRPIQAEAERVRTSRSSFIDTRPVSTIQSKLHAVANASSRVIQLRALQALANDSPQVQRVLQLQALADAFVDRHTAPWQRKLAQKKEAYAPTVQDTSTPNFTGLPNTLKSGIEHLSGYAMDDVRVHYNSRKPATVQAHAYAQGTDIHLAAGQEKHLPHEAWHVVQQKQGRVQPTLQMKGGVPVNDDDGLEREADEMGEKAAKITSSVHLSAPGAGTASGNGKTGSNAVVQRVPTNANAGNYDAGAPAYTPGAFATTNADVLTTRADHNNASNPVDPVNSQTITGGHWEGDDYAAGANLAYTVAGAAPMVNEIANTAMPHGIGNPARANIETAVLNEATNAGTNAAQIGTAARNAALAEPFPANIAQDIANQANNAVQAGNMNGNSAFQVANAVVNYGSANTYLTLLQRAAVSTQIQNDYLALVPPATVANTILAIVQAYPFPNTIANDFDNDVQAVVPGYNANTNTIWIQGGISSGGAGNQLTRVHIIHHGLGAGTNNNGDNIFWGNPGFNNPQILVEETRMLNFLNGGPQIFNGGPVTLANDYFGGGGNNLVVAHLGNWYTPANSTIPGKVGGNVGGPMYAILDAAFGNAGLAYQRVNVAVRPRTGWYQMVVDYNQHNTANMGAAMNAGMALEYANRANARWTGEDNAQVLITFGQVLNEAMGSISSQVTISQQHQTMLWNVPGAGAAPANSAVGIDQATAWNGAPLINNVVQDNNTPRFRLAIDFEDDNGNVVNGPHNLHSW